MVEIGETVLINPKILQHSEEVFSSEESCLSLPDFVGYVHRYKKVTVEYQDILGNKKTKEFSDYNAAVVQHEIDHLHGILFIDKLIIKQKASKK
jgi:peptide deformylase